MRNNLFVIITILLLSLGMISAIGGDPVPEYEQVQEHRILAGETLWSISNMYVDAEEHSREAWIHEVKNINELDSEEHIQPGQKIKVPVF